VAYQNPAIHRAKGRAYFSASVHRAGREDLFHRLILFRFQNGSSVENLSRRYGLDAKTIEDVIRGGFKNSKRY
jgi:Mor family transcriptional regulator